MVAYTALYMLRQDYSQIDLFALVRTCSLGKKLFLPAVGKLLAMGNWVNGGWRNTEGWWEKQSLLVTNATSEMTIRQSFVLILYSSAAPPAQHWLVWLGQKLGSVLGKWGLGKQLCGQSANLVYYAEKFISLFFCLLVLFSLSLLPILAFEIWLFFNYCYLRGQF